MKLYVGNLPSQASEVELRNWFEREGFGVDSINIMREPSSGRPRGFGFVQIADDEEAVRAMLILNRKDFLGHTLMVNEARTRRVGGRR